MIPVRQGARPGRAQGIRGPDRVRAMSPRAQQARRGAGAASWKISGPRGGDKGRDGGHPPSPVILAKAGISCGLSRVVLGRGRRAVDGPRSGEATVVAATLSLPNKCDPKTARNTSKSPGRGAARRSRGGAARLDSARYGQRHSTNVFFPANFITPDFEDPALLRISILKMDL